MAYIRNGYVVTIRFMTTTCNNLPATATVSEAAAIAAREGAPGLSAQSIRRACDTGALQHLRVGRSGVRVIFTESLLGLIRERARM